MSEYEEVMYRGIPHAVLACLRESGVAIKPLNEQGVLDITKNIEWITREEYHNLIRDRSVMYDDEVVL